MVVYVPNSIGAGINAPSLLWFGSRSIVSCDTCSFFFFRIHGGSFTSGSASDPAINGANLAAATQSIVAVVQYRLGGVQFHPSSCLIPY
jgi:acetyl esterase/lipase